LAATTEALETQGAVDPITGLSNRRHLLEHGAQELSFARGGGDEEYRLRFDESTVLGLESGKTGTHGNSPHPGRLVAGAGRSS
jgi:hypothetical protein